VTVAPIACRACARGVSASFDLDNLTVSQTGILRIDANTLISHLNSGQAYVNVHTVTNPGGEIRGQISED
jgi:hypothetical protein